VQRHVNLKEVILCHILKSEADVHGSSGGDVTLLRDPDESAEVSGKNIGYGRGGSGRDRF
jgi:hypothetical protein